MEILAATLPGSITRALEVLHAGGIVAHATETCYGFACDLANPRAVERLFEIKARPADQPVSALFASIAHAKEFVEWLPEAAELAERHLPGPLTIILRLRPDAPKIYPTPAGGATIGMRVSSHPIAAALAARFGAPISTTSANLHGQPNAYSAEAVIQQFSKRERQPDLLLHSGAIPPTPPSTIIDLTDGQRIRREGTIRQ